MTYAAHMKTILGAKKQDIGVPPEGFKCRARTVFVALLKGFAVLGYVALEGSWLTTLCFATNVLAQGQGETTGQASAGPPRAAVGKLEKVAPPPTAEESRLQQQFDARSLLRGRPTPVDSGGIVKGIQPAPTPAPETESEHPNTESEHHRPGLRVLTPKP